MGGLAFSGLRPELSRGLRFGTAGVPRSTPRPSTLAGVARVAELGLGAMEVEFVWGARLPLGEALAIRQLAQERGVSLSAHAPYFVNLNAHESDKLARSRRQILQAARLAFACGASSLALHPAFYLGDEPQAVYHRVKAELAQLRSQLQEEGNPIQLRPELAGRSTQFGSFEELLGLSQELERVAPCLDFAHLHAREGRFNSYEEFASVLERLGKELGPRALQDLHLHVSGIRYGSKGEIKHLPFGESDLRYPELLQALKDFGASGVVICESPLLEDDALLLQETYRALG